MGFAKKNQHFLIWTTPLIEKMIDRLLDTENFQPLIIGLFEKLSSSPFWQFHAIIWQAYRGLVYLDLSSRSTPNTPGIWCVRRVRVCFVNMSLLKSTLNHNMGATTVMYVLKSEQVKLASNNHQSKVVSCADKRFEHPNRTTHLITGEMLWSKYYCFPLLLWQ